MPPKKGGKKGKAAKAPAYASKAADCEPFGFLARDLIRTPLGLDAVVLGVKYPDPKRPGENGVMWVQYAATKLEAPIEDPKTTAGYTKLSEGKTGSKGAAVSLAFSLSGRMAYIGFEKGSMNVCDAFDFSSYDGVSGAHEGQVIGMALSPDGTGLATAGFDGLAKIWTGPA